MPKLVYLALLVLQRLFVHGDATSQEIVRSLTAPTLLTKLTGSRSRNVSEGALKLGTLLDQQ
jgi:hypothetical protein